MYSLVSGVPQPGFQETWMMMMNSPAEVVDGMNFPADAVDVGCDFDREKLQVQVDHHFAMCHQQVEHQFAMCHPRNLRRIQESDSSTSSNW